MTIFMTPLELQLAMQKDVAMLTVQVAAYVKDIVVNNVQKYIYDANEPYKYQRRGEEGGFLGSWEFKFEDYSSASSTDVLIYSNPGSMVLEPPAHGYNRGRKGGGVLDRRPIMAEIIAEGTNWDFNSNIEDRIEWWKEPNPYFDNSIIEIDDSIDDLIQIELVKLNGTNWVKG